VTSSTISGFNSPPLSSERKAATIRDILQALDVDMTLAQNLFARVAKKALVIALEDAKVEAVRKVSTEFPLKNPLVVVSNTVYLNLEHVSSGKAEHRLMDLIEGIYKEVVRLSARCTSIYLVEALGAQVQRASEFGDIKFQLKQKVSYE